MHSNSIIKHSILFDKILSDARTFNYKTFQYLENSIIKQPIARKLNYKTSNGSKNQCTMVPEISVVRQFMIVPSLGPDKIKTSRELNWSRELNCVQLTCYWQMTIFCLKIGTFAFSTNTPCPKK